MKNSKLTVAKKTIAIIDAHVVTSDFLRMQSGSSTKTISY
jgi:hypothetical protein